MKYVLLHTDILEKAGSVFGVDSLHTVTLLLYCSTAWNYDKSAWYVKSKLTLFNFLINVAGLIVHIIFLQNVITLPWNDSSDDITKTEWVSKNNIYQ